MGRGRKLPGGPRESGGTDREDLSEVTRQECAASGLKLIEVFLYWLSTSLTCVFDFWAGCLLFFVAKPPVFPPPGNISHCTENNSFTISNCSHGVPSHIASLALERYTWQAWSIIVHRPLVIASGPSMDRWVLSGQTRSFFKIIHADADWENFSYFYGVWNDVVWIPRQPQPWMSRFELVFNFSS